MKTKLVDISPSPAARFHAFSSSPEMEAWAAMEEWARSQGLWVGGVMLGPDATARVYGYNNPDPSAGSPNYGYEFLVTGVEPDGAPEVVDFPGGRYLVVPFAHDDPMQLPAAWKRHAEWAQENGYEVAAHQWLERHIPPGFNLELYLPVR